MLTDGYALCEARTKDEVTSCDVKAQEIEGTNYWKECSQI